MAVFRSRRQPCDRRQAGGLGRKCRFAPIQWGLRAAYRGQARCQAQRVTTARGAEPPSDRLKKSARAGAKGEAQPQRAALALAGASPCRGLQCHSREDAHDHRGFEAGRDGFELITAVRAAFEVDLKDPLEQPGPADARLPAVRIRRLGCGRLRRLPVVTRRRKHRLRAPLRVRSQRVTNADQVLPPSAHTSSLVDCLGLVQATACGPEASCSRQRAERTGFARVGFAVGQLGHPCVLTSVPRRVLGFGSAPRSGR